MIISADRRLFEWINALAGTWHGLDNFISFLASDFFFPVLIATAAWALWFLGRTQSERLLNQVGFVYAAGGVGFSNWAIHIFNQFFYRPRPFLELDHVTVLFYRATDSSFPSNAAAFAFAMATGVWLVHKRLGLAIGVAACVFSGARVFAGMHYPFDVAGGALLGILATYFFSWLLGLCRSFANFWFSFFRVFYLT